MTVRLTYGDRATINIPRGETHTHRQTRTSWHCLLLNVGHCFIYQCERLQWGRTPAAALGQDRTPGEGTPTRKREAAINGRRWAAGFGLTLIFVHYVFTRWCVPGGCFISGANFNFIESETAFPSLPVGTKTNRILAAVSKSCSLSLSLSFFPVVPFLLPSAACLMTVESCAHRRPQTKNV